MKKFICILLCTCILCGCTQGAEITETSEETIAALSFVEYDEQDLKETYKDENPETITFKNNAIEYSGSNASVSGNYITITTAGTYVLSGTLIDGSVIVDAAKEDFVHIVFDNIDLSCKNSAPIYVKQAKKVVITLAEDSVNKIMDGTSYTLTDTEQNEPNATIFSKDDLTINGSGTLEVSANYNNGIQSKDDLKIVNGTISVTSADDSFVGKDLLAMKNGTVNISSKGDGMKTTNAEDTSKGQLVIEGGTLHIKAAQDGLQSENELYIYAGTISIETNGGVENSTKTAVQEPFGFQQETTSSTETISSKGMKATNKITVSGGDITLNTAEDAVHSNGSIEISDGIFVIHSSDDGFHADDTLIIQNGTIDIQESYEGLEAMDITIQGGTIHIVASDDGINAANESDTQSMGGPQGQGTANSDMIHFLGGYVVVNAQGDGLDSNGSIEMSDGTLIVYGPNNDGNSALDYDGSFSISKGTFIATGSAGMMQTPSEISNGGCVSIIFDSVVSANTSMSIQSQDDTMLFGITPVKDYQSVIIYSTNLMEGTTYNAYYGGMINGTMKDGINTDGTYSDGSLFKEFTITSGITSVSNGTTHTMGNNPSGKIGGQKGPMNDNNPPQMP